MNKSLHAILFVLIMAMGAFLSSHSKAISMGSMSLNMLKMAKEVLTPDGVKAVVQTSMHALWTVAKYGAIVTVVGNVILPDSVQRAMAQIKWLRKFIFNRGELLTRVAIARDPGTSSSPRPSF